MSDLSYGKYCDHTVLKAFTPRRIVRLICEEAIEYNAASVCVNPVNVAFVKEQLKKTDVRTCCVVGFPLGANKPSIKAAEALEAVNDGADEIDTVINIGAMINGDLDMVYEDIKAVVDAVRGMARVKVIIETCYLNKQQKIDACRLCMKAGADYVKTSTGFGPGGATVEDVLLMKDTVGDKMKIKAASGINTREDAEGMIAAGASRLGTSKTPCIVTGKPETHYVSRDNKNPVEIVE